MPSAPAPRQSTGSIVLGWGMISIPCSLYTGTQDSWIKRSEYIEVVEGEGDEAKPIFHKVGRALVDNDLPEDAPQPTIAYADIVRLFDTGSGLVPLSDDEIAAVIGDVASGTVEMFLPLAHLAAGTYVPESVMQIRPKRDDRTKKVNIGVAKAFNLLLTAMREEQVFALVQIVLRGKPKYAILTPDGRFTTVMFDEEVREDLPLPEAEFSDAELAVGRRLVQSITSDEPMELVDTAAAKVRAYAEAKAAGSYVTPEAPAAVAEPPSDLMALLEASVAANRSEVA